MSNFKIGLASVTFRNKNIEQIVIAAKSAGAECIEWGGDVHVTCIESARKAKDLCRVAGIEICSYGSYYRIGSFDTNSWVNICKIARELSAKTVRVWLGDKASECTCDEEYGILLKDAGIICDIADDYDLIVSAECHRNTYNDTTDSILKFINDLNRENFKTYFQSLYIDRNYDSDRIKRTKAFCDKIHISYRDLKREQRYKSKDNSYIDFLLNELQLNDYNADVLIEFTRWDSEKQLKTDLTKMIKHLYRD